MFRPDFTATRLEERVPLNTAGPVSYFVTLDPPRRRFRLFKITDAATDAIRVYQHLVQSGKAAAGDNFQDRLQEVFSQSLQRASQSRTLRPSASVRPEPIQLAGLNLGDPKGGPRADAEVRADGETLWLPYCNLHAGLVAIDPIFIQLVRTMADLSVFTPFGFESFSFGASGDCWTNADTGLSSWNTVSCDQIAETWSEDFVPTIDVATYHEAIDWLFAFNASSTSIWQMAAVNFRRGFTTWAYEQLAWGEFFIIAQLYTGAQRVRFL